MRGLASRAGNAAVLNVTGDHSPPARNRIKAGQANKYRAFTFGEMADQNKFGTKSGGIGSGGMVREVDAISHPGEEIAAEHERRTSKIQTAPVKAVKKAEGAE